MIICMWIVDSMLKILYPSQPWSWNSSPNSPPELQGPMFDHPSSSSYASQPTHSPNLRDPCHQHTDLLLDGPFSLTAEAAEAPRGGVTTVFFGARTILLMAPLSLVLEWTRAWAAMRRTGTHRAGWRSRGVGDEWLDRGCRRRGGIGRTAQGGAQRREERARRIGDDRGARGGRWVAGTRRGAHRHASPRSQIQLRRRRCWSSSTHTASHPVGEVEGSRVGVGERHRRSGHRDAVGSCAMKWRTTAARDKCGNDVSAYVNHDDKKKHFPDWNYDDN
jgi:hypothetical protein